MSTIHRFHAVSWRPREFHVLDARTLKQLDDKRTLCGQQLPDYHKVPVELRPNILVNEWSSNDDDPRALLCWECRAIISIAHERGLRGMYEELHDD